MIYDLDMVLGQTQKFPNASYPVDDRARTRDAYQSKRKLAAFSNLKNHISPYERMDMWNTSRARRPKYTMSADPDYQNVSKS